MNEDVGPLVLGDAENTLQLHRTPRDDELLAILRTPDLTARRYFRSEEHWARFSTLADILTSLAIDWKGFEGERSWVSGDETFRVICTHDHVRSIRVMVSLRHHGDWEIELPIRLDLGRLDDLKNEVERFFAFATRARA